MLVSYGHQKPGFENPRGYIFALQNYFLRHDGMWKALTAEVIRQKTEMQDWG